MDEIKIEDVEMERDENGKWYVTFKLSDDNGFVNFYSDRYPDADIEVVVDFKRKLENLIIQER